MVEFKIVDNTSDLLKAFYVRGVVFIEEQECSYNEEFDNLDYNSYHFLGEIEGEPVAAARVRLFKEYAKIERLAVRKKFRKQKIGKGILLFIIDFLEEMGFNKIVLHAQAYLLDFYTKFGFIKKGEKFKEVNIDHYLMERIIQKEV